MNGPMHAEPDDRRDERDPNDEPTGWLDLARVVAIAAVVMVHEAGKGVGARGPHDPATPGWWAAVVLDAASRWCVPVFLMVSGALLLDPRRTDPPGVFYRRRAARIGVPLVVWTAGYLVFGHVYLGRPIGIRDVARAVGSGSPFMHLYYLYVIAGLYLLAPFLRETMRAVDRRARIGLGSVLLVIGMADQSLMTFVGIGEPNAATRFVPYLGYFVAGRLLREVPPRPGSARRAAVVAAASIAVTVAGGGLAAADGRGWGPYGEYAIGYLAPNVVVMSLAVFRLLHALGTRPHGWRPGPRTARLAELTFGVYLVHAALWYPLVLHWHPPAAVGPYLLAAAWHWLVALAGAAAITAVMRRIPLVRRLV